MKGLNKMFGSEYILNEEQALKLKRYRNKITYKNKKLSKNDEIIQLLRNRKKENKIERDFIIIDDKKFLRGVK